MPNFYVGQPDYIDQLNALATANSLLTINDNLNNIDANVTAAAASATAAAISQTAAATSSTAALASQTAAANSATTASTQATAAANSASTASTQATAAAASATAAANSASTASTQATAAAASATAAANSASTASTQATAAAASATAAANSASTASTQATNASNSAATASNWATTASTHATNAANSATTASTQATAAAASATAAANSASTASTQATNASNSASTASTQATNAANSATTASNWASTASAQATIATNQATTATTQAGIATAQAGTATTQAGIATAQAGTATTQAGIATAQAGTATTQATNAAASALAAANSAASINLASPAAIGNVTPNSITGTVVVATGNITGLNLSGTNTGDETGTTIRTKLGSTTVGTNLNVLTNPSAITFLRINADNTVSALDAASFRTAIGSSTGSVTSISVASSNGFAGSSSGGATPTITVSTSITGLLKGNGTAISAASAGTDYLSPGGALGTPSSGNLANCTFPTLNQNTTGSAGSLSSNASYMFNRGSVADASIDTATANGFYTRSYTGASSSMLTWNAGGSTGPVQLDVNYGTAGVIRLRSMTDSTTWSGWRTFITDQNIASQSVSYATSAGSATSATSASGVTINYSNDSASTYQMLWGSGTGVYGTGNIYCNPSTDTLYATTMQATDFNTTSDRNKKKNIYPLCGNLLSQFQPVGFDWKESGIKSYGLIAQEIELTHPELVATAEDGTKSISYIPLIAMLIATVQDLTTKVEALEARS